MEDNLAKAFYSSCYIYLSCKQLQRINIKINILKAYSHFYKLNSNSDEAHIRIQEAIDLARENFTYDADL